MKKLFIYPTILISTLLLFSQSCKHKCAPEPKPVPPPVEKCTPFAATWVQITPGNDTYNLRDATIIDANNAVFFASTLMKTTDGGNTFSRILTGLPNGAKFWGGYFFDMNTGFAAGGDFTSGAQGIKILQKTIDGGLSWQNITIPASTGVLHQIRFINNKVGIVAGSGGVVLKTIDGGTTWNALNTGITSDLAYITINNNSIFISGSGVIIKSIDEGKTWTSLNIGLENTTKLVGSLYFFDEKTGFAVGQLGLILKTTDGGNTWNTITSATIGKEDVSGIIFVDKCNGYVSGNSSNHFISKTTDGGQTWTKENINPSSALVRIASNGFTGYAYGDNGLIFKLQK